MQSITKIINLTVECGQIVLENGGETHRVEKIMKKVSNFFGMQSAESYVTLTGIMLTITDQNGEELTVVRRIKNRTVDLQKIVLVEKLLNNLSQNDISAPSFGEELQKIKRSQNYTLPVVLAFSGLTTGAFTLLFGGSVLDFFISFIIGIVLKSILSALGRIKLNDFFTNMFGGALSALLALSSTIILPNTHHEQIVIGAIMLLVPGLAITNAIRDTIAGDLVSGIVRGIEAFLTAVGIAAGSGLVYKLWFFSGI